MVGDSFNFLLFSAGLVATVSGVSGAASVHVPGSRSLSGASGLALCQPIPFSGAPTCLSAPSHLFSICAITCEVIPTGLELSPALLHDRRHESKSAHPAAFQSRAGSTGGVSGFRDHAGTMPESRGVGGLPDRAGVRHGFRAVPRRARARRRPDGARVPTTHDRAVDGDHGSRAIRTEARHYFVRERASWVW